MVSKLEYVNNFIITCTFIEAKPSLSLMYIASRLIEPSSNTELAVLAWSWDSYSSGIWKFTISSHRHVRRRFARYHTHKSFYAKKLQTYCTVIFTHNQCFLPFHNFPKSPASPPHVQYPSLTILHDAISSSNLSESWSISFIHIVDPSAMCSPQKRKPSTSTNRTDEPLFILPPSLANSPMPHYWLHQRYFKHGYGHGHMMWSW